MNISTTHEDSIRPEHDAAASALAKATEALNDSRSELAAAQQALATHEDRMGTESKLPKNFAHDGAELSATVQWFERMAANRAKAVSTAQADYDAQARELALAQIRDRAEAIASFDRDEFVARFAAKLAPIAAEAWDSLNSVSDLEREITAIAKTAGIDSTDPRYTHDGSRQVHTFDGIVLNPAGLTAYTVNEALAIPENPRTIERRDALNAEDQERRQAERQREAEAVAEAERNAPQREARARFERAHANWRAERDRRVRSLESTATMNPEPVFANRATW